MIHLVLGGARSGKSRFAETLALESHQSVTYIATATAGDSEMQQRIDAHKNQRPKEWRLVEEPFNLANAISEYGRSNNTLLIECMTLWSSNWLCTNDSDGWIEEKDAFIDELIATPADVIIVSNEVGSGVVPMGELSRQFVDQAGWLNQALTQIAHRVTLVVAGCSLSLKSDT